MKNEQVVLRMVAHRLRMLIEQHEPLQNQYGGEMTEIVHLAEGVIVEASEDPMVRVGGSGLVNLSAIEVDLLSQLLDGMMDADGWRNQFPDAHSDTLNALSARFWGMHSSNREAGYRRPEIDGYPNPDPDEEPDEEPDDEPNDDNPDLVDDDPITEEADPELYRAAAAVWRQVGAHQVPGLTPEQVGELRSLLDQGRVQ